MGLGCAVLSAFGTNLAFLYKHRGAVAAPDVDMRHPLRSAADLFRSKWWTIGWLVAVAAFLAHVGALSLLPLSTAQAVLSGGFVLLAVLAERFFGFQLGRRQWIGIILVAVSLALLGVTSKPSGDDSSDYSLTALILFEGGGIALGLLLIFSHRIERVRAQHGILLGAAAGLGFGISDVAIKAVTDDLESRPRRTAQPLERARRDRGRRLVLRFRAEPAGGRWRGRDCHHLRRREHVLDRCGDGRLWRPAG